jgi:hypothetical protein
MDHSAGDLAHVAAALGEGRLSAPFSTIGLARLGVSDAEALSRQLNGLGQLGFQPSQIAILLGAVIDERKASASEVPELELVVTGPREEARDTAVVVEQLFEEASMTAPFQVRSATVQHRRHGGVNGWGKGRGQGL